MVDGTTDYKLKYSHDKATYNTVLTTPSVAKGDRLYPNQKSLSPFVETRCQRRCLHNMPHGQQASQQDNLFVLFKTFSVG